MKIFLAVFALAFATPAFAEDSPTEYITQVLEPTGGKIERPKDWLYTERHHGPVLDWVISREDTHDGKESYTTGVRIQMFVGIKQGTGKTAEQFIADFVASKKKDAKVVSTCDAKEQGMFTRMCLETEEGPHHILYSLFWSSEKMDIAVVTIAGTTKELWKAYAPVFDKMSAFELLDMKHLEQKSQSK